MGLRGCCSSYYGFVYLVYRKDYCLEVRLFIIISVAPTDIFLLFVLRTQFRREANVADNKAATVAIDSLINYEAVKVMLPVTLR